MRIGVSSRGRPWVSMGCLGWLLFGWLVLPALALYVGWQVLKVLWVLTVALVRLTADVCSEVYGWHADRPARQADRPLGMDKPFNWPPRQ